MGNLSMSLADDISEWLPIPPYSPPDSKPGTGQRGSHFEDWATRLIGTAPWAESTTHGRDGVNKELRQEEQWSRRG